MKNEQPKPGRPGETSQWPRWEGPAESRPSGYLQGEANIFAEDESQEKHIGKAPLDYSERPDHLIEQEVKERLTQDPFLDPTNITVSVSQQRVTLEGFVEQEADRQRAEACVNEVAGVGGCDNRLSLGANRH